MARCARGCQEWRQCFGTSTGVWDPIGAFPSRTTRAPWRIPLAYARLGNRIEALRACPSRDRQGADGPVFSHLPAPGLPRMPLFQVGVPLQAVFVEAQQAAGLLVADLALAQGGLHVAAELGQQGVGLELEVVKRLAHEPDHSSFENSSTLRLAALRIARRVPRSSSRWSGTATWAKGSSRRRMMWLPFCRRNRKPAFLRAAAHSRPEMLGSLLTLPAARLQNVLPEQAGRLPVGPRRNRLWRP